MKAYNYSLCFFMFLSSGEGAIGDTVSKEIIYMNTLQLESIKSDIWGCVNSKVVCSQWLGFKRRRCSVLLLRHSILCKTQFWIRNISFYPKDIRKNISMHFQLAGGWLEFLFLFVIVICLHELWQFMWC